jgi:branched-chain amino acid transport system substrate-binding protein
MRRSVKTGTAVAALGMALAAGACGSTDKKSGGSAGGSSDKLVVGFAAARTGGLAPFDQPVLNGIQYAVDKINAAGGIGGKMKIELRTQDMRSEPAVGATAAQQLIDDGANILITPCDADSSIAAGQIAERANVPAISSCASTPTVPKAVGHTMHLAVIGDNAQGAALAEYARKKGYQSVYILKSPDTGYTQKLPEYFAKAFTAMGGTISGEGSFKVGESDFSAQVTTIKNLGSQPDAIMTAAYVPDGPTFIRQLRGAGVKTPVLGSDGLDSETLFEAGGKAIEGLVFTTHGFPSPGGSLEKFYADYKKATGKDAGTVFTAVGYDVVKIIEATAAKAGSTKAPALLDAMDKLQDVPGATSPITYAGTDQVARKEIALVTVKNGKLRSLGFVLPKNVPAP